MIYEIYGVLDYMLLSAEIITQVAIMRLLTTLSILTVFGVTFCRIFRKYNERILSVVTIFASISLLWTMSLIDELAFPFYFAGLLLFFFWIHAFQVLSFPYVVFTASLVVVCSLLAFTGMQLSLLEIASYSFILLTAASVSIFSAYITEKHHRFLFLRQKELDRERYIHRERSMRDTLTSLPNRALLFDRINQAIEDANRNAQICAGFFLDLDDFKKVNDTYGHAAGDAVLKEVSERLKAGVRAVDTVARLSGDEFFVLAHDIKNEAHAVDLGTRLLNMIKAPYHVDGKALQSMMSVSVGICLFPYEGVIPTQVVARADSAMYQAKVGGKGSIVVAKDNLLRSP
jgi:diguanylate cyclase (GGDEF)-like protein